jgi:DNA-directed RNA polymerase specialized sigma24 family protein
MHEPNSNPLAAYAESGSESAFGEVVEKYAGMVFGVAMRRTGNNRPLCEEVTQNVFTILARKAGAPKSRSPKRRACAPGLALSHDPF